MVGAAIPREVIWSYAGFVAVVASGLIAWARDGAKPHGSERLIRLGPVLYGAPLTGFGIEHYTQTRVIASIVPRFVPWPLFWTYVIGAGFVLGGFSLATRILAKPSAVLIALTFFCFVVLMDLPAWAANPGNRFGLALALRELSFGGGALALAVSLGGRVPGARRAAGVARWCVAIPVLVYSLEQFLHGAYVPGIPLNRLTPPYVVGHAIWTYLAAGAYAVGGVYLALGRRARVAATGLGVTVLVVELAVYVPIAIVDRASLVGFNFLADTLMFGGALLLVAGAMPPDAARGAREPAVVGPVAGSTTPGAPRT